MTVVYVKNFMRLSVPLISDICIYSEDELANLLECRKLLRRQKKKASIRGMERLEMWCWNWLEPVADFAFAIHCWSQAERLWTTINAEFQIAAHDILTIHTHTHWHMHMHETWLDIYRMHSRTEQINVYYVRFGNKHLFESHFLIYCTIKIRCTFACRMMCSHTHTTLKIALFAALFECIFSFSLSPKCITICNYWCFYPFVVDEVRGSRMSCKIISSQNAYRITNSSFVMM